MKHQEILLRSDDFDIVIGFKPAILLKITLLYTCFLTFCNAMNGLKSQNTSQISNENLINFANTCNLLLRIRKIVK